MTSLLLEKAVADHLGGGNKANRDHDSNTGDKHSTGYREGKDSSSFFSGTNGRTVVLTRWLLFFGGGEGLIDVARGCIGFGFCNAFFHSNLDLFQSHFRVDGNQRCRELLG